MDKLVGYKPTMSLDQATYIASLADHYRQSGQSEEVFLQQLSQTNPDWARYLFNLSPTIRADIFSGRLANPDDILTALSPRPKDINDKATTVLTETLTDVS